MNKMKTKSWGLYVFILTFGLVMQGCGGGGGGSSNTTPYEPILYVAIYNGSSYNYAGQYYITGAPDDTDWYRWGTLHDGSDYRLYFMKEGTDDTIYQFAYNPGSADYEFGYNSIRQLRLTNIPADADTSSFAMSHVGNNANNGYYAHMKSLSSDTRIYTFRYNGTSYAYERSYNITGAPADTDWLRWGMLIGDGASRFYAGKMGDDSTIYQFKYNPTTQNYEWGGTGARPTLSVTGMPADSDTSEFGMLNNGSQYRYYNLNNQN
jgi:hypothetical protein